MLSDRRKLVPLSCLIRPQKLTKRQPLQKPSVDNLCCETVSQAAIRAYSVCIPTVCSTRQSGCMYARILLVRI